VDGKYVSIDVFDLLFDNDKGCSWNEISGRYVQLEPEFYIPKVFRGNVEHGSKQKSEPLQKDPQWHEQVRKNWLERTKNSYAAYIADLGSGIAREQARSMLPQNIYTQAIWTVSLQSIMHFLSQRCKEDAQHEIREYANTIKSLCIKHTPNLSKILE
jgi:thymidylate synthase (FAD)